MKEIYLALTAGILTLFGAWWPVPTRAQLPPAPNKIYCLANPNKCAPPPSDTNGQNLPPVAGGRIFIDTDAWFGKSAIAQSNQVQIGHNTVIISGKQATVPANNGTIGLSYYALPSTGKLNWNSIENDMVTQIQRLWQLRSNIRIGSISCNESGDDSSVIHELWLDGVHNASTGELLDPTNRAPGESRVIFDSGPFCNLILEDAVIHVPPHGATFALIYVSSIDNKPIGSLKSTDLEGGSIELRGKISVDPPTASFGIVTMASPQFPGSGDVVIKGNTNLNNVAIFTSGTIRIEPNSNVNAPNRDYAKIVGKTLALPITQSSQKFGDTYFEPSATLEENPPPLFQSSYLPNGKDAP